MLFIGTPSNLFLRLNKMRNFAEFIFAFGRIWDICGTNFCDFGPKSQKFVPQKLMPQHFMPAKINALKVSVKRIFSCSKVVPFSWIVKSFRRGR